MTAPAIYNEGIARLSDIDERILRHTLAPQAAEACASHNEAGAVSMPNASVVLSLVPV